MPKQPSPTAVHPSAPARHSVQHVVAERQSRLLRQLFGAAGRQSHGHLEAGREEGARRVSYGGGGSGGEQRCGAAGASLAISLRTIDDPDCCEPGSKVQRPCAPLLSRTMGTSSSGWDSSSPSLPIVALVVAWD